MWSIKRATVSLAAIASCAGLTACATALGVDNASDPINPISRYGLQVEERPDQVALRPHPEGLSANQKSAIAHFVGRWRTSGGGEIVIDTPSTGADPNAISRAAAATLAEMQALGVPSTSLRFTAYEAGGQADAPVVARYDAMALRREDCSTTWDNLVATGKNTNSKHFGCVVNANMAMQIARPQDVVTPAVEDPADAARRATVLGKYRAGENTSTKRDDQATTAISGVARQ